MWPRQNLELHNDKSTGDRVKGQKSRKEEMFMMSVKDDRSASAILKSLAMFSPRFGMFGCL